MDKTKRIMVRFKWHCRRAGGLFLGLRIHFPCQVVYDNGEVRMTTYSSFGFLFATLEIEFRGKCLRIRGA
jgi:hypothetical protein